MEKRTPHPTLSPKGGEGEAAIPVGSSLWVRNGVTVEPGGRAFGSFLGEVFSKILRDILEEGGKALVPVIGFSEHVRIVSMLEDFMVQGHPGFDDVAGDGA